MGFSNTQTWVQMLELPLKSYVVLEKLLKFTESHVYNGDCDVLKMTIFSATPPIKSVECNGILLSHKKEMLPFAITWMNLEGIILNKSDKDKYHVTSLICRI